MCGSQMVRYAIRKSTGTKPTASVRKNTGSSAFSTDMKREAEFVICIGNKGYAASLELRKIYQVVLTRKPRGSISCESLMNPGKIICTRRISSSQYNCRKRSSARFDGQQHHDPQRKLLQMHELRQHQRLQLEIPHFWQNPPEVGHPLMHGSSDMKRKPGFVICIGNRAARHRLNSARSTKSFLTRKPPDSLKKAMGCITHLTPRQC